MEFLEAVDKDLPVARIYIPDMLWDSGYVPLRWLPGDVWTNWPIDKRRVYEFVSMGDSHYILLKASAFHPAPSEEEDGEGLKVSLCCDETCSEEGPHQHIRLHDIRKEGEPDA